MREAEQPARSTLALSFSRAPLSTSPRRTHTSKYFRVQRRLTEAVAREEQTLRDERRGNRGLYALATLNHSLEITYVRIDSYYYKAHVGRACVPCRERSVALPLTFVRCFSRLYGSFSALSLLLALYIAIDSRETCFRERCSIRNIDNTLCAVVCRSYSDTVGFISKDLFSFDVIPSNILEFYSFVDEVLNLSTFVRKLFVI